MNNAVKMLTKYESKHPQQTIPAVTKSISGQGQSLSEMKSDLTDAIHSQHDSITVSSAKERYTIRTWIELVSTLAGTRRRIITIKREKSLPNSTTYAKKVATGTITTFSTSEHEIIVMHTKTYLRNSNKQTQTKETFNCGTTTTPKASIKQKIAQGKWKINDKSIAQ